jgi:hypothetical protein
MAMAATINFVVVEALLHTRLIDKCFAMHLTAA